MRKLNRTLIIRNIVALLLISIACSKEEEPTDGTFTTVWNNTRTVTIPTREEFTYNYEVDWGDGTVESFEGDAQHTFETEGRHTIKGNFPAIFFDSQKGQEMANKIISVNQWGAIEWKSMFRAFKRCKNLKINATDKPNLSNVRNMLEMFMDNEKETFNTVEFWDTSHITNMGGMFRGTKMANPNVRHWNVSQVSSMRSMFKDAERANPDMSGWNITNKLLNMEEMLDNSGISAVNYARALENFAQRANQEIIDNVTLGAENIEFCSSATDARNSLRLARSWQFFGDSSVNCN